MLDLRSDNFERPAMARRAFPVGATSGGAAELAAVNRQVRE
jgi:hypothetical protein